MFKMNLKKALALLASVLMLCSLVPVGALLSANAGSNNIVVNGGFEDEGDNWAFNSGSHEFVNDAHSGDKALSLTNPGLWSEGAVQTVSVSANSEYTITWWSKRVSGAGAFNLYTMNANGYANLTTVSGQNWMNETSGNWVKNTYVVNTGTATSVILKWSTEATNPGTILLDDIEMSKAGGEDPEEPVSGLQNGDFETGDETGWTVYQGTAVKTDAKKNGSYGMHLTGNGGWGGMAFQNVTVEPGKEYTVSMWLKAVTNGVNIQVKDGGTGGTNLAGAWFNATSWTKVDLVATPTTNTLCLNICGAGNGVSESVYLDDVTVTVKGGSQPDTPPANGLKNGDFELGNLDGWTPWQNTEISADAKKNGSYGATLKGDGGWGGLLDQNFTVEAGKTYTLSFWFKANAGGANFVVKENGTSIASYWGNATAWTQHTMEFTASSTDLLLNICGGGDGVASNIYVDDFVLTEKSGGEPDTPPAGGEGFQNGDFETGDLTGWTPWQNTEISADAKKNGSYGATLKGDGGWGGLLDQNFTVEAGKTYTLSFWFKANAGGANFVVKENGTSIASYWGNATAWTQHTMEFTASSTDLLLNICGGGDGVASNIYVDDFVLTEKSGGEPDTPPAGGEGFQNGDFETGDLTGWTPWQNTEISADAKKNGSYGAKLVGDGGWGGLLDQTFSIEAGKTYTLSFWYKANAGGANFVVKENGTGIASHWGNATSWTQITLEFTPTTNSLLLNICGGGDGIPAELYVDDFVLAAKPSVQMGLINGNFEDGTNGWTLNADSKLETSDVHAGNGALYVSAPNAYGEAAYQVMGLEPATDYVLTWYAKRVSGNGAYCVFLMNESDLTNIQGVDGQTWMNETSGDWVKYEVTFNSGTVTEMRMKWGPENNGAGVVLVDDIVLQKAGEEPVDPTASLIKNGSFESGKDDWSWGGESQVLEGDFYEGAHSAKLVNNSAWGVGIEQVVKVEKNTDYVLRFYTKRVTGKGVWRLSLMDNDTVNITNVNLETTSGQAWFDHTTTNKWEEHIVEFNSGEVTKVLVKFGPETDNAGSFLIDYIGMWTKGNEPSPDDPDNPVVPPKAQMFMTSFGVLNNRPINQDDNLLSNPSFEKSGGEWKKGFKGDTISVVKDKTTLFGDKSLFFNTAGIEEETKLIFWMDVEPDTAYVFSTWLKGAYLADDNRGLATIGIVDENGKFLSNLYQEGDITRFLNGERQIVPTAWDNEWHLRGIEFNTGECTKVGIALAGKNSQMWIDDMALFQVGQGKKYMSANAGGTVSLSYTIDSIACEDKDSLIPDPTFSKGTINDFWKTSYGWRNGFLSLVDNKYEYGTSLKYTATGDNAPLSIIKTIEVKPNTEYTFAVDVKILEDGWGKLVLCDGKKREPISFLEVSFDSYDYDEDAGYYGWYTTVCKFNTDVYDKISLAIVDDGGEALLDNMRLYESAKGTESNDKFIVPPEENQPEEEPGDDWYGDDWYPEYPIEPDVPVEDPIVEPEPFDPPVDEPEPVPDNPVAPVVNDEGNDAWIWVAAGGGAALLAGAGVFLFFFLKKKKTTPPTDVPTDTPAE